MPAIPHDQDAELGIAWWNNLSDQDRKRWMARAGNTGRVVDAWRAFKRESAAPADLARRSVLGGIAVAIATLTGAAALPVPAVATVDPIFAAIERHREASERYDAAVSASAILAPEDADFDPAEALTDETNDALIAVANDLLRTEPATLAGVIAMTGYLAGLKEWQEPVVESGTFGERNGVQWRRVALTTVTTALTKIQVAGGLS